jgi:ABC-type polysaccharide/polyol phosphate export permease
MSLNWNKKVRQTHRFLAVLFTVTVVVTSVGLMQEDPAAWVSYLPLLPLALLFVTGVNLYVLPYLTRRRGARRPANQG